MPNFEKTASKGKRGGGEDGGNRTLYRTPGKGCACFKNETKPLEGDAGGGKVRREFSEKNMSTSPRHQTWRTGKKVTEFRTPFRGFWGERRKLSPPNGKICP